MSGVFHGCYGSLAWLKTPIIALLGALPGQTGVLSRPAARVRRRNGYRGEVAKKSRNRGGGTRPARPAQAAAASGSTAQTGTAQLTAPAAPDANQATSKKTEGYPGQRLGLPERGPGSVASMPRRLAALLIDWLLSMLIA